MRKTIKRIFCIAAALMMLAGAGLAEGFEGAWAVPEGYTADRVVILSRHNIRSPLSEGDSMLGKIVPHEWFNWSSPSSELSVRGGLLETNMGQFYRKWMEYTGLFPRNYQPEKGAVRFYANSMQRTLATARFFATGLLPVADVRVEQHSAFNTMDDTFSLKLRFSNERYAADATAQIAEMGGIAGMDGLHAGLADSISLLIDVTDMEQSEHYTAGEFGDLMDNHTEIILEEGAEPKMTGAIKTATSVADAMLLQYYEEPDAEKAAFGHELTEDQWRMLTGIVSEYGRILFTAPLIAINVANPMLREIRGELTVQGRKFTFLCGHDANIASVLAALGAEDYTLPDAIETRTPIGVKIMFLRLVDAEGKAWYDVSLVYQTPAQMRGMEFLDESNTPVKYAVRFENLPVNADGLVAEEDLLKLLDERIDAYTLMKVYYTTEDAEENAA